MKKLNFTLLATAFALSVFANPSDTTIVLENRKIQVIDEENRLRVRVFEVVEEGDAVESRMIFEGHYRDGRVHERRHISRTVEVLEAIETLAVTTTDRPSRRRRFDPHWEGFGIGFNSFIDNSQNLGYIDGASLNIGRSIEWTLNLFEQGIPINRNFGFVTGLGMRWNRYHLSSQTFFDKEDGTAGLFPIEDGRILTRTRLGVNRLTVPLLFEWQANQPRGNRFFLSAGVVGEFNYRSASKIRFVDSRGIEQRRTVARDLYVRPFTYSFLLQSGFGSWGLYAKYSPMELFRNDKGPNVQPVSMGIMLHF